MIKNERQYKVSRAQLARFKSDAEQLSGSRDPMARVHLDAIASLQEELLAELSEYEALRDGRVRVTEVNSIEDLPRALIRARIASKLTHKELANRLDIKEQQLQRWESEDYRGASLAALRSVAESLGIAFSSEVVFPISPPRVRDVRRRLGDVGVTESLLTKILSPEARAAIFEEVPSIPAATRGIVEIARVLRISIQELLAPESLRQVTSPARFKTISRASSKRVHAYAAYAHYVAALAIEAASIKGSGRLPNSWQELRRLALAESDAVTFESVLKVAWDCGIVVIPMRGSGAFHGAVWKIRDRVAIVLKQTNEKSARWLFDLLHEIAHAALGHVTDDQAVIEEEAIRPVGEGDPVEVEANEWAEDFLFGGDSEGVEEACLLESGGNMRRLSAAVKVISNRYDIDVGVLANHMAWRLSSEGKDWWGAAENLQKGAANPYEQASRALFANISLENLNSFDRDVLLRAVSEREPT